MLHNVKTIIAEKRELISLSSVVGITSEIMRNTTAPIPPAVIINLYYSAARFVDAAPVESWQPISGF